jgi:hypothetical protein
VGEEDARKPGRQLKNPPNTGGPKTYVGWVSRSWRFFREGLQEWRPQTKSLETFQQHGKCC